MFKFLAAVAMLVVSAAAVMFIASSVEIVNPNSVDVLNCVTHQCYKAGDIVIYVK